MAGTILAWALVTALCFVTGSCADRLLARLFGTSSGARAPFALVCGLGLAVVTTLLAALTLVTRLGPGVQAGVVLGCIALGAAMGPAVREEVSTRWGSIRERPAGEFVLFAAGALLVLFYSTLSPDAFDSGTYHFQAIRWNRDYRVVPGLGNLLGNLALNSHWFVACAGLDNPVPSAGPLHALSGLLLVWLLAFCTPDVWSVLRGDGSARAWTRALLLVAIFARHLAHCSSPVTELPTTLFFLLLLVARMDEALRAGPFIVLALWLPTLKLSALGALFLIPLALRDLDPAQRKRAIAACLGLGFVIATPWVLRNLLLSGYPLYPSASPDVFDADWKIPRAEVEAMSRYIRGWARIHDSDVDRTMAMSLFEWVPRWFAALAIYGKIIVAAFALLPVVAAFRATRLWRERRDELLLWGSVYAGTSYWFLSSPDTRFGFPYLVALCLLLARSILSRATWRPSRAPAGAAISLGILCFGFAAVGALRDPRERGGTFFAAPAPAASVREERLRRGRIFVPNSGILLWDAPLPSTFQFHADLEWRGDALQDGFRRRLDK